MGRSKALRGHLQTLLSKAKFFGQDCLASKRDAKHTGGGGCHAPAVPASPQDLEAHSCVYAIKTPGARKLCCRPSSTVTRCMRLPSPRPPTARTHGACCRHVGEKLCSASSFGGGGAVPLSAGCEPHRGPAFWITVAEAYTDPDRPGS